MSVPFERQSATLRHGGTKDFLRLAARCARNVYDATDRHMPEALTLAQWLSQCTRVFGLADESVPDDDALHRAKRRGSSLRTGRRLARHWRRL